jgi:hypothetical protein
MDKGEPTLHELQQTGEHLPSMFTQEPEVDADCADRLGTAETSEPPDPFRRRIVGQAFLWRQVDDSGYYFGLTVTSYRPKLESVELRIAEPRWLDPALVAKVERGIGLLASGGPAYLADSLVTADYDERGQSLLRATDEAGNVLYPWGTPYSLRDISKAEGSIIELVVKPGAHVGSEGQNTRHPVVPQGEGAGQNSAPAGRAGEASEVVGQRPHLLPLTPAMFAAMHPGSPGRFWTWFIWPLILAVGPCFEFGVGALGARNAEQRNVYWIMLGFVVVFVLVLGLIIRAFTRPHRPAGGSKELEAEYVVRAQGEVTFHLSQRELCSADIKILWESSELSETLNFTPEPVGLGRELRKAPPGEVTYARATAEYTSATRFLLEIRDGESLLYRHPKYRPEEKQWSVSVGPR